MDWSNTAYTVDVGVTLVDPLNVDKKLGSLNNVILDGLTISENYDSDSRVQAKISTVSALDKTDGYIDNARLRIFLSIPEKSWSKEMFTGYVSDIKTNQEETFIKKTYTVESTLWGLLNHRLATSVTINKGVNLIKVWTNLMSSNTKMQYSTSGAQDKTFTSVIMYEPGTVLSTLLFEITDGTNRMDVDTHGRVLLKRYIAPTKQTPTRTIDLTDSRGLIYGSFNKTSNEWSTSGREIVTANVSSGGTSQKVIAGYYDAPTSHRSSIARRGYLISHSNSYSGSSKEPTKNELTTAAENNWKNSQSLGIDWDGTTIYADYHAGDIVWLSSTALSKRKCLIREVTTNLSTFTQDITLEEV